MDSDRENLGDDNDYDFAEDNNKGRNQFQAGTEEKGQVVEKHHHDEVFEVSEDDEIPSDPEPEENPGDDGPEDPDEKEIPPPKKVTKPTFTPIRASVDSGAHDEGSDEESIPGAYNPADYNNLNVAPEVKDLFTYITRFHPQKIELETKLKAFIPNYIPAIGEVDAFLKPAKPDDQPETLGLLTIDEPCLNQSKESSVWHQIRARSTKKTDFAVHSIENADKNPNEINRWINDTSNIQRQPPSVVYSKKFPDVESLLQIWPAEVEEALQQGIRLPTEEIDMNLEEYAKLACALVDIPVHQNANGKNIVESLHVFFTLYAEFKANPFFGKHFEQQVDGGGTEQIAF